MRSVERGAGVACSEPGVGREQPCTGGPDSWYRPVC